MLSIVDGGEKLFLANFTLSLSAKSLTGEMVISQNKNSLPNNILLMQVIYKMLKDKLSVLHQYTQNKFSLL